LGDEGTRSAGRGTFLASGLGRGLGKAPADPSIRRRSAVTTPIAIAASEMSTATRAASVVSLTRANSSRMLSRQDLTDPLVNASVTEDAVNLDGVNLVHPMRAGDRLRLPGWHQMGLAYHHDRRGLDVKCAAAGKDRAGAPRGGQPRNCVDQPSGARLVTYSVSKPL
jgi:hypothetical protein